jgi:hypothetical protein
MQKDISSSAADRADAARAFLLGLRNEHYLVAISVSGGAPRGFRVDVASDVEWAKAAEWIKDQNGPSERCGIYYHVNPLRSDFTGVKARKADVSAFSFFHADLDPFSTTKAHEAACNAVREGALVISKDIPMAAVCSSGNGIQALWKAEDGLTLEDYEAFNKRLNRYCDTVEGVSCKGTMNADRIFRVPGTWNWPSKSKLAKGYDTEPVRARMLATHLERQPLTVDAIKVLPVPVSETAHTRDAEGGNADWPPALASDSLIALHDQFMLDQHYANLVSGEAHGGDRSDCLMGVVARYKRHGLSLDESASLVGYVGGEPLEHVEDQTFKGRAVARAYERSEAVDVMAGVADDTAVVEQFDTPKPMPDRAPSVQTSPEFKPPNRGLLKLLTERGRLQSRRETHVYALAGALAGLSAASAGAYVLETPDGLTPLGLLVMGVGPTAAGKEMVTETADRVVRDLRGVVKCRKRKSRAAAH